MSDDDETPIRHDAKNLETSDVASIFDLKNELLKRKSEVADRRPKATGDYALVGKKGGVLAVKKEEKNQLKSDASERKRRIAELEAQMKKEERETLAKQARIMQEKSELYDKLREGSVVLTHKDDTPVEFLTDFLTKKRLYEEDADRASAGPAHEPVDGPSRVVQPERFNPDEEQRNYGVSHVKLSQDEERRQEQIKQLYDLSDQTAVERAKRAELMRKREEEKKSKIAALRKRMGLPELKEPSPLPEPVPLDIPLPPEETVEEKFKRKIKSDREWDRGKGTYNTWIQKQREEREDEFRPPDFYYK